MNAMHLTAWEDDGMVGVECSEAPEVVVEGRPSRETWTLDIATENPKACPHCGTVLRLVWDVRLEVVSGGTETK